MECRKCGDWGTVGKPPEAVWCDCSAAQNLHKEVPHYLMLANDLHGNPPQKHPDKNSNRDVEFEKRWSKEQWRRQRVGNVAAGVT